MSPGPLGAPLLIPPIPLPPPPPQVAQSGAGNKSTTMKSAATREICSLITLTPLLLIKSRNKVGTIGQQLLRHRATVFASVRCAFGVKRRMLSALYDRCDHERSTHF